jgi:hypothetical protein
MAVVPDQAKVSTAYFLVASEMNLMSLGPDVLLLISKTKDTMKWLVMGG